MPVIFELSGRTLKFSISGRTAARALSRADFAVLRQWADRAQVARMGGDTVAMAQVGSELFAWLSGPYHWLEAMGHGHVAGFAVEFRADARLNDGTHGGVDGESGAGGDIRAFLQAPWELLTTPAAFLAGDTRFTFAVTRSGVATTPPPSRDIGVLRTLAEGDDTPGHALPVAGRGAFSGREQETREVLDALRAPGRAGVVIEGNGRVGKTSLAAHVTRLCGLRPVVIRAEDDPLAVLAEILKACDPAERRLHEERWLPIISKQPERLRFAVETLLKGPLSGDRGVLLIADGVEATSAGRLDALRAIVDAFVATLGATESRLLLTGNAVFSPLGALARELAHHLHRLPLAPLDAGERLKLMQERLLLDERRMALSADLQARIMAIAGGYPGLQNMLTSLLLEDAAAGEGVLADLERYLVDAAMPQDGRSAVLAEYMLLGRLLDIAGPDALVCLRAGTVFAAPVPEEAFDAAAVAVGFSGAASVAQRERLARLGLLERVQTGRGAGDVLWCVTPAARQLLAGGAGSGDDGGSGFIAAAPLLPGLYAWPCALSPDQRERVAQAVLAAVREAWMGDIRLALAGMAMPPHKVLHLTHLAWLAHDLPLLREAAAASALLLYQTQQSGAGGLVAGWALHGCEAVGSDPGLPLHLVRALLARSSGDDGEAERHLKHRATLGLGDTGYSALWMDWFALNAGRGQTAGHRDEMEKARVELERLRTLGSSVLAAGTSTDIYQAAAEFDEALRVLSELMPALERSGDVYALTVAMNRIAEIRMRRGQLDEALRTRREQKALLADRAGASREYADTLGHMADVYYSMGLISEASSQRKEQVPFLRRLGYLLGLASALRASAREDEDAGEPDEALEALAEEAATRESIGDPFGAAEAFDRMAEIHEARGEWDEALRILREEELPLYEQAGDLAGQSATLGKMAEILHEKGDTAEALQVLEGPCLTLAKEGGALEQAAGVLEKAISIRKEKGIEEKAAMERITADLEQVNECIRKRKISLRQQTLEDDGAYEA